MHQPGFQHVEDTEGKREGQRREGGKRGGEMVGIDLTNRS